MIHVICTIEVAEGRRDDFLAEFHKIVPLVHQEEGCVEYGAAVDAETGIDAQAVAGPNVVTAVEKWESVRALEAHLAAPHMNAFREKIEGLVQGMMLYILDPA